MKRLHRIPAMLAATGLWLLAGCLSSNSPTSSGGSSLANVPGSQIGGADNSAGATVAGSSFDAVSRDMQAADSLRHGPCGVVGLPLGIPSGCPFDAASQSFVCAAEGRDGLTDIHSYQFLDAGGATQGAYDALTTASIRFSSHVSGTTTSGPRSTVDDSRQLTESGFAGSETVRIFNGGGTSTRDDSVRTPTGGAALIHSASSTVVADVAVPSPWGRESWPLSGTLTTHLVSTGGPRAIDQTSVIHFNGTPNVSMTVGDTTVTIDLRRPPHGRPPGPPPGGGVGRH